MESVILLFANATCRVAPGLSRHFDGGKVRQDAKERQNDGIGDGQCVSVLKRVLQNEYSAAHKDRRRCRLRR